MFIGKKENIFSTNCTDTTEDKRAATQEEIQAC